MHDTLNGVIAHSNHNLIAGIQATVLGGTTAAGSEYVKHVDVQQISWLTSHAIGVLTVGDCISLSAAVYVLTGFWRFYVDMKDRHEARQSRKRSRK